MIARLLRAWCWFTGRHGQQFFVSQYRDLSWFKCSRCGLLIPRWEGP